MTSAANSILWGLGAFTTQTRPPQTDAGMQKPPATDQIDLDCPDVFELLEVYDRWFGQQENKQAEAAPIVQSRGETSAITYRIVEADQNMSAADDQSAPQPEETTAQPPNSIAETLAKAERALQALPDMPPKSRLKASLNALEAALAGTSLSDLEALLADNIADRDESKCA